MKRSLLIASVITIFICVPVYLSLNDNSATPHFSMAQDTLRPTIEYWNISSAVYHGLDFEVSAYVWDAESGVENVTLEILNSTSFKWSYELIYNGSHYVATIPALQVGDVYRLHILAYDKAGNSATSYTKSIDLTHTATTVPEWATFPIVVISSLLFMFVIMIVSWNIKKRQSAVD